MTSTERNQIADLTTAIQVQTQALAPLPGELAALRQEMTERAIKDERRDGRIARSEELLAKLWEMHRPLTIGERFAAWAVGIGVISGLLYIMDLLEHLVVKR